MHPIFNVKWALVQYETTDQRTRLGLLGFDPATKQTNPRLGQLDSDSATHTVGTLEAREP